MAKYSSPILFSAHFGVDPNELDKANLLDPFLNVDLELFIDPVLLEKCSYEEISKDAVEDFQKHFNNVIRLLAIAEKEGDVAWKGAEELLNLKEPPENGLGYGGSSRSGSSRSDEIKQSILRTTSDIIRLGAKDPDMISLMGFFEEGVGPDTISDFTTRVIFSRLARITKDFCKRTNVTTQKFDENSDAELPVYDDGSGKIRPFLLVPKDIVRDLPIANDWSDVQAAAMLNDQIRTRVSQMLAGIATPTVTEYKEALRSAALSSSDAFNHFLASVMANAKAYDADEDILGYFRLRHLMLQDKARFEEKSNVDLTKGPEAIRDVVLEAIEMFKKHVEVGDLWKELWSGDKPKLERASQIIFQLAADSFCKANNIDMSPEANMGGGPVDFKFSSGYEANVLVELKRDTGKVRHGYEVQLEHYKKASNSFFGIFVVIDYGKLGGKLETIQKIRNERIASGQRASDIIVIDATPKVSASKKLL